MKILLIIEIILIFIKIILGKYIKNNYWELMAMGSKSNYIYAIINMLSYAFALVILIELVFIIF